MPEKKYDSIFCPCIVFGQGCGICMDSENYHCCPGNGCGGICYCHGNHEADGSEEEQNAPQGEGEHKKATHRRDEHHYQRKSYMFRCCDFFDFPCSFYSSDKLTDGRWSSSNLSDCFRGVDASEKMDCSTCFETIFCFPCAMGYTYGNLDTLSVNEGVVEHASEIKETNFNFCACLSSLIFAPLGGLGFFCNAIVLRHEVAARYNVPPRECCSELLTSFCCCPCSLVQIQHELSSRNEQLGSICIDRHTAIGRMAKKQLQAEKEKKKKQNEQNQMV